MVEGRGGGEREHVLADPAAGFHVAKDVADDLAIADDWGADGERGEGDFVGLRDGFGGGEAAGEAGAGGDAFGIHDYGNIIVAVDFDVEGIHECNQRVSFQSATCRR